ncbi:MAG TPA: RodZ domain-containing protein [Geobacteraceae bacterium]|nr:RodZ domain-containing protein [Geobacteraceae bacterium]
MKTVGSYLREVRESLGIQLEEAASVTRIGKNYLIAIEGEMFEKLPSSAYVKGFLRIYAGYLGLSGDEIVAMYDKSLTSHQTQPSRESGKDESHKKSKSKIIILRPSRLLIPLFLLAGIMVAAYFAGDKKEKTGKEPPVAILQPQVAAPPKPAQTIHSSATRASVTPKAVADTLGNAKVISGGGQQSGIILRLKVNQDCWLYITIDNALSQQYDLKAGDLIEWKGDKVFALDIGNAGGIEAEFNGKPLKLLGEPGKTAHLILKGEGS